MRQRHARLSALPDEKPDTRDLTGKAGEEDFAASMYAWRNLGHHSRL